MKFLFSLSFLSISIGFSQTNADFFVKADAFFKTYVLDGKVDYEAVQKNGIQDIIDLTDFLATNPYDKSIEKAYLINAYNLFVIEEIIQRTSLKSPNDLPDFFEYKNCILNLKLVSLNQIENELLRQVYADPKLHFVLVCGALSCPPITNFAYTPELLDKQINSQTIKAINNPNFIYEKPDEKAIYLSKIFEWYAKDFGKNNTQIIEFINTYRTTPLSTEFKLKYYEYDWTLNNIQFIKIKGDTTYIHQPADCVANSDDVAGQTYNAGTLLRKGQFDYTLFNTLYTQTKSNWQGIDYTGNRETFNTHLFQITYGISKSKRINVGLDINFKSSGKSVDSTFRGISSAFTYKNTDTSRVGITSIGLRLKAQPFKKLTEFTLQSTLLPPTIKFAEGKSNDANGPALYWADWERLTWWNQFFYSKTFKKFQLFAEVDLLFRLKIYKNQSNSLDVPLSLFFSYFPTHKITFYLMSQHVPRFVKPSSTDWLIPSNYTASGAGFKYQINRGLNIELLYTNFWRGKNNGIGSTFNLGIKYITK